MKLNKLIALFLSLILILTVTACSGNTPSSSTAPSSSQPSSSAPSSSIPEISNSQTGIELGGDEVDTGVWNGKVADGIRKGGGTAEHPYLITSAAEFAYALTKNNDNNYYYKLETDIYLNDVTDKAWMQKEVANPWFTGISFDGHLDGNGHTVNGIYIPYEGRPQNAGLISKMSAGSIKNLGIRNSFIVGQRYSGAFVGQCSASDKKPVTIENCFVDETVYVQYTEKGTYGVGGIVGYIVGGDKNHLAFTIQNCYSKAQLAGIDMKHRVNGIVGTAWDCAFVMKNCYSIGYKPFASTGTRNSSLLLDGSHKKSDVFVNNYTDVADAKEFEGWTKLSRSAMTGAGAKSKMKLDFEGAFATVEGGTPKLKIFEGVDGKDIKGLPSIEDMIVHVSEFASGRGTKEDPYVVANADQLRLVVQGSWENTYFVLNSDIYVNNTKSATWLNTAKKWYQSVGSFSGNFDGNNFSVYGLYYDAIPDSSGNFSSHHLGLFPRITTSAVIKNVCVRDSVLTGEGSVGAIAGGITNGNSKSEKYAVITGCFVSDTVYLEGQNVGGIFGAGGGGVDISYCGSAAVVSDYTREANGIVADIWSKNYKLSNCYSVGLPSYRGSFTPVVCEAVYATVEKPSTIVIKESDMQGSNAKNTMSQLDWNGWKTTSDYPLPKKR